MSARVTIEMHDLLMLKADARGFSLRPRQPVGSLLAGRHASRLRGRGLDFEELRHYHQGDDIRLIDWKATARRQSTQMRVYTEERQRPVLLVVDQRRPMFFGSRGAMKSVAAAEAAALGAWRVLDMGDCVGGLVFGDNDVARVRPHRSRTRALNLLHHIVEFNQRLATGEQVAGDITLNQVLESASRIAKHDHLVVLISDLDGANDETQRLATQIAAHNDMLVVAIYDPLGIALTGLSGMLASDRGRIWEVPQHASFAADFQKAFERRLEKWRGIFRALQVPLIPISTSRTVAQQLRALLGYRPRST